MSSGYTILALSKVVSDEDTLAWLNRVGLTAPEMAPSPPPVTPDGVRHVFRDWGGCTLSEWVHGKGLTLNLMTTEESEPTRAYTQATIEGYAQDHAGESMGHWLRFGYGSPEFLVTVAERFAQKFGPMLLMHDASSVVIVTPGTLADEEWADI